MDVELIVGAAMVVLPREQVITVWNVRLSGWCLPGGKNEPHERGYPKATAARELHEETGLRVADMDLTLLCVGLTCISLSKLVEMGVKKAPYVHVYHAFRVSGHARTMEKDAVVEPKPFRALALDPVFGPFYMTHFPDGIHHLKPTVWEHGS